MTSTRRTDKRRRLDPSTTAIPFSEAQPWRLMNDFDGIPQRMAVDNDRCFIYFLMHVPFRGQMVRQVSLSIVSQLVSTMTDAIPELAAFPPGILPIIAFYADVEGETRWDSFISVPGTEVDSIEVDPISGQLICSSIYYHYIIKMYPNGTLHYIQPPINYHEGMAWIKCVANKYFMMDARRYDTRDLARVVYQLQWQGPYYLAQPLYTLNIPNDALFFLINEHYLYFYSSYAIYSLSLAATSSPPIILFRTPLDKNLYSLKWCGPNHFLLALVHNTTGISLLLFDLLTHSTTCVATKISRTLTFDFSVVHPISRGPSILLLSGTDLRTIPLPLSL